MPSKTNPKRGDILRIRLDPVEGSEQAGERPALVISPAIINNNSPVILIASITSRKTEKVYPFDVLIEPPEGGLTLRSKVLLLQLRSIDKKRILGRYGSVTAETMLKVSTIALKR
jgi:mRNA interferase MazF